MGDGEMKNDEMKDSEIKGSERKVRNTGGTGETPAHMGRR